MFTHLVGVLEHVFFVQKQLGIIIPPDELIPFRGGRLNNTPDIPSGDLDQLWKMAH